MNGSESRSMWKSILIGGTAAGILSIIPILNLLNLFFMMWMAVGGGLSVYLFMRENRDKTIKTTEALLTGALSGVWGCAIFGVFVYTALSRISPEKFAKAASLLRTFFPDIEEEVATLLHGGNLKELFLLVFALLMIISIIAGALGGIVSKSFTHKEQDE
ncbi:hypothetical protein ACFLRB_02820 [Acidobacteriota bacterium]